MVKIICKTSKLKCDDFNLKTFAQKSGTMCDLAAYENIEHVALSCTYFSDLKAKTFNNLKKIPKDVGNIILDGAEPVLSVLLGKIHPGWI